MLPLNKAKDFCVLTIYIVSMLTGVALFAAGFIIAGVSAKVTLMTMGGITGIAGIHGFAKNLIEIKLNNEF
jgi:hypothetical protein